MQTRQAELDSWSQALSETVADAIEEDNLHRVELLVQRYGSPKSVTLRVIGRNSQLLFSSAAKEDRQIRDWFDVPGVREALQGRSAKGVAKGLFSNDDRLYVARPITRNGQLLGVLRMSITLEQFQSQFRIIICTVVGTLFVTLLLCALISEWLARNIAKPIQAMSHFAVQVGSGNLGKKLYIYQKDELGQLAIELNRMSERLASLDKERRAFLANVSHELRTPVSNVIVTLEALENGADEEPELRGRFIHTAIEETKRLSRLIKDLLDLGRLEAGVTPLEQQPLNLRNLLNRAVRAMEPRMRSQGVEIVMNVTDLHIDGDPERLLQAFLNVLDNAIKHSTSGGTVIVVGKKEGGQVVVKIQDRGTGISDRDLPHIFEQFYTADRSRKGSSTGLGLAISRRIVEAHGGRIAASSIPNQGATFTIYLPISPQESEKIDNLRSC